MRIETDDADRIVKGLMVDHESARAHVMRGGFALAVLLDDGLPTERAVVVDADGEPLELDGDVRDVVHYALDGECCCEERSDPDAEFVSTSPLCPVHGQKLGA